MTREIFFLKNYAENKDFFLRFKKAQNEVEESGLQVSFNTFQQPSTSLTIKTNCIKPYPFDPEICSILIFQKSIWN